MQTVSIQTANRHEVIVEQMIDQAQQLAAGWEKLSRKQKLQAWADWTATRPSERVFHQFHRVLSAIESVH
ncbi:MAG: hypothetical protein A3E24_09905 [Caulobacterales bacterium RIFCSPHIGHO2_12_FULL_68_13]|jgi:hypothetical protein|nr:MAG: hypothetical protein A3E24_09905 [Caulobacterales bacterium RIFCSPHIGHO2_12_FULL_68_13]